MATNAATNMASMATNMATNEATNSASQKTAEGSKAHERKRVVVIGAGMSGVATARHLVRHGGFDVVILESRQDRFGGRIWSESEAFSDGAVVDLGAAWISGSNPQHPLTKLRDKFDVDTVTTDSIYKIKVWDGLTTTPMGKTKVVYNSAKFFYYQRKIRHAGQRATEDASIKEIAEEAGLSPSIATPFALLLRAGLWESMFAASYDRISAKLMDSGQELKGSEEIFPQGYKQIVSRLVEGDEKRRPLKIIFGAIVSRVSYSEDDDSVLVVTDDGTEYAADCTVVTVPLGVLKAGDITFEPPLDSEREHTIERVGYGTVNKLALEFDKPFWDDDTHIFAVTPHGESPKDLMYLFWVNMHVVSGKPILTSVMGGDAALVSESMSEEDLKEIGLSRLRSMFGEAVVNERKVVSSIRTKWNDDPFAKGSYSFPAIGQHEDDWHKLGKPIGRLIHFAGEHTHQKYYGYVHGAYLSGLRAANEIIGDYFPEDKSSTPVEETVESSNSEYNCTIL